MSNNSVNKKIGCWNCTRFQTLFCPTCNPTSDKKWWKGDGWNLVEITEPSSEIKKAVEILRKEKL